MKLTLAVTLLITAGYSLAEGARKSSLRQLMAAGKPLECTMNRSDAQGAWQGKVFIAGKELRGDYTVTNPQGESYQAHTLQDAEWLYTWGGPMGDRQGTKIRLSAVPKRKTSKDNQAMNLDQEVDIECQPWKTVRSTFVPPKDVTFQDLSDAMTGMPQQPMTSSPCSACDQAPAGPTREKCRQALGCS